MSRPATAGAPHAEALVEYPAGIGEDPLRPAPAAGERREPLRWAEADQDQPDAGVAAGLVHLDQVLLAGQSMPVPQQHQHLHTADLTEVDGLPAGRFGEPQAGHVDQDGF